MQRLRFVLLCDAAGLERWHLRCLEELEDVADLVGVVAGESGSARCSRLLQRYATRAFGSPAPVEGRLERLPPPDEAVDFVLRLGRVPVPAGLAGRGRLGVWRFEHEAEKNELPFLAEVYAGTDVTQTALVATRDGRELVLEHGVFRIDTRSYAASRSRIESAIAGWPARACRRLSVVGLDNGFRERGPRAQAPPLPHGAGLVGFTARMATRRAGLAWQRFFRHPQWNVGVLDRPVASLLQTGVYADEEVDWYPLEGTAGFLADPFAIERDGRLRILCEYFDYRAGRGRIRALEYSAGGFSSRPADILSPSRHVSYPYLLDLPEGLFCVPETATAGEIALYRSDDEGESWSKVAVLVPDVPGVDPTVFRHDDRWWLTCTRLGPQEDAELWVWHASDLAGPWLPHALNPVKTDVRGARPGGRPFVHDGVLYRPAQDCSHAYGGRIALQRVTRLSPTAFAEELATTVEGPRQGRYPIGPHTLTPVGDVVLVDGRRTVFVPAAFRGFLALWVRALSRRPPRMR